MDVEKSDSSSFEDLNDLKETITEPAIEKDEGETIMDVLGNGQLTKQVSNSKCKLGAMFVTVDLCHSVRFWSREPTTHDPNVVIYAK
jgi:hypothetical protein